MIDVPPALRVEIVVKGRLGPIVGSALVGLDAEVRPRHDRLVVASGGLPAVLTTLECLERRGVDVDRIIRLPRGGDRA